MKTSELIHLQLELECIGVEQGNHLAHILGGQFDDIARVYVFNHADENWLFFRNDVDESMRIRLQSLGADKAFHDPQAFQSILEEEYLCDEVFMGQTYLFPETLSTADFSQAVRITEEHRTILLKLNPDAEVDEDVQCAVIEDGQIVSICASNPENSKVGEAYVWTDESYRQRGFGRQATAAWAYHLQKSGKIAFYTHKIDNSASRRLAISLGLQPCFRCVNFA